MALPKPKLGLVISYSYLWHREHRTGQLEGSKDRPCVIVLAADPDVGGGTRVRVVPVTHSPPLNADAAMEIPRAVKAHLGLDAQRSWVVLDEVNEFIWPGFDIRPTHHEEVRVAYGFLPPKLFTEILRTAESLWIKHRAAITPRD